MKHDDPTTHSARHGAGEVSAAPWPPESIPLGTAEAKDDGNPAQAIFRTGTAGAEPAMTLPRLFSWGDAGPSYTVGIYCDAADGSEFFALATRMNSSTPLRAGAHFFPVYLYDEDGSIRRENITDWAVDRFQEHYRQPVISKWSIFDYVYGVLHHPGYRQAFAQNLMRELPRIPFAPDFRTFQRAGQKLIELHLHYDTLEPWELKADSLPAEPGGDEMPLSDDKTRLIVNPSLALSGIPPETFDYRLGNLSALEWMITRHPSDVGSRRGIDSSHDDRQSLARRVGQIIRMSVETAKVIQDLPSPVEWGAVDQSRSVPRVMPS